MTERTLVVFKPDAVQRGIVGEILTRFERLGLQVVGGKMITVTEDLANKHYPTDRLEFIEGMGNKTLENYEEQGIDPAKDFDDTDAKSIGLAIQKWLVDFITAGPVLALVLEGPHAVSLVRKHVGHTLPYKAAPGTIRGDFSFDSSALANIDKRPLVNLLHASGDIDEAKFEIALWFGGDELHDYQMAQTKVMRGKVSTRHS